MKKAGVAGAVGGVVVDGYCRLPNPRPLPDRSEKPGGDNSNDQSTPTPNPTATPTPRPFDHNRDCYRYVPPTGGIGARCFNFDNGRLVVTFPDSD
jgi:hypothetical protein